MSPFYEKVLTSLCLILAYFLIRFLSKQFKKDVDNYIEKKNFGLFSLMKKLSKVGDFIEKFALIFIITIVLIFIWVF